MCVHVCLAATLRKLFIIFLLIASIHCLGYSQSDSTQAKANLFDLSLEELMNISVTDTKFKIYGFVNANVQKSFSVPELENDKTIKVDEPLAWSAPQNFHLYGSAQLSDKIDVFINLARTSTDGIEIRNAWGNFKIANAFQVKVGKMYRKFGLYNEKLDQIPAFIGIEAPELFDVDHLFLTRTANFMIHGNYDSKIGELSYALTTENPEGGPTRNTIPLGWDLRLKTLSLMVGTSGFMSSVTDAKTSSTVELGKGSPRGGVLPWMEGSRYHVLGGFVEKQIGNLLIQSEYWVSHHNAMRNPASVLTIINNASINSQQREQFLGVNAIKDNAILTTEDVVTKVSYKSQAVYVRLGYNIDSKIGQFVPYVFGDWMNNPEVINNKTYGGDN